MCAAAQALFADPRRANRGGGSSSSPQVRYILVLSSLKSYVLHFHNNVTAWEQEETRHAGKG